MPHADLLKDRTLRAVQNRKPVTTTRWRQIGNIFMERQEYETAIRAYSKAIRLEPTMALTYTKRGQAYQALGKESLALKDFSKANDLRSGGYRYSQQSKYDGRTRNTDWEILPPGWWHDPRHREQLESQFRDKEQAQLFLQRLEYLDTFNPTEVYRSRFSDQGSPYYAYVFAESVVAENPLEGNAIYVIRGLESWQSLLKLSKENLRHQYPSRVKRIVHRGDWETRLQREIL